MTLGRSKHILLVEDDEAVARMVRAILEPSGYGVQAVATGEGGVRYATEHQLDLVILDINLPDINGYQVAQQLRKLYHPWVVPLLMLTIKDKPVDQLRGFAHGADAYLPKPFDSAELQRTIAFLLGEQTAGV